MRTPKGASFHDRLQLHLSNERTFLSWTRTAISLIAVGFLLIKFDLTDFSLKTIEEPAVWTKSKIFGSAFILFGVLTNVIATVRFIYIKKEIDLGRGSFPLSLDIVVTVFIVIMSLFLIIFSRSAI